MDQLQTVMFLLTATSFFIKYYKNKKSKVNLKKKCYYLYLLISISFLLAASNNVFDNYIKLRIVEFILISPALLSTCIMFKWFVLQTEKI